MCVRETGLTRDVCVCMCERDRIDARCVCVRERETGLTRDVCVYVCVRERPD
jgi:hypothetical protein